MSTVADILGPAGRIAQRLDHYEDRPQQLQMARAVDAALRAGEHLVVEAGTGVGKSFAYLVPAILWATEAPDDEDEPPRRVVVSTHTISLQEQLMFKDLPFLKQVTGRKFSAVLVKGRGNYLSLRRLQNALKRANSLFGSHDEMDQLRQIKGWVEDTADGSRSDLDFQPLPQVWDEVASDSGNCLGRKCDHFASCFYYQARRRVSDAQILVVNHALLFSDLALRAEGGKILPDYAALVFDEAHTVEAVAGEHLGLALTSGQVEYILTRLYNDRTNKGLLVHRRLQQAQEQVDRCRQVAHEFFDAADQWRRNHGGSNGRVRRSTVLYDELSPALDKLAEMVREAARPVEDASEKKDFVSASNRLKALATQLNQWNSQMVPDAVYWIEAAELRRGTRIKLAAAPIDIGPAMKKQLLDKVPSVIFTSATLAVGKRASFEFFNSRVGLNGPRSARLGSPFNYREQAKLVVVQGMPDPAGDSDEYERLTGAMIRRYAARTDGHAFALFTSNGMLRRVADRLRSWLAKNGLDIHCQTDGTPRHLMLERFKVNPRAVLFGTVSFWQGVDVPGDALTNVIITKLPFSVPDHPLLEARLERIREQGGNPFMDYQLPEAIIRLRQGFGRLIRTQRDRGMVVLLDPRIRTRRYGRLFVDSLPPCQVVQDVVGEE